MNNLDEIALKHGTPITEKINYIDKDIIMDKIKNTFTYEDNNTPIPGQDAFYKADLLSDVNEQSALDSLITKAATVKAQQEKVAEEKVLTKEEKAAARKQFIDAMLYQQGEMYYQKYHYLMDGQTKRRIRKKIEHAYDTGKYNKLNIYFDQQNTKKQVVRNVNTTKTSEGNVPVSVQDIITTKM